MLKYTVAQTNEKKHSISIDILRILAILAVIMIHTTSQTLQGFQFNIQKIPWTLFLDQVTRFAVPLFFFISGFVLELSYRGSFTYSRYIKRRASRILVPYIFWSFVYSIIIFKNPLSWSFLITLILGNAEYHLYFIPTLIIFYILFPLIHKNYQFFSQKKVIIPILLVEMMLLGYDYYLNAFQIHTILRVAILNFGIFLLGIIAHHHQEKLLTIINKWKHLTATILGILIAAVYYESKIYFLTRKSSNALFSQYRPLIYIYTLVLAGFLFWLFTKIPAPQKLILNLSKLSFFVFFIHIWFLDLYYQYISRQLLATHNPITNQLWYDPFVFILVAGLSFGTAYLVHKIPYVSKVTG